MTSDTTRLAEPVTSLLVSRKPGRSDEEASFSISCNTKYDCYVSGHFLCNTILIIEAILLDAGFLFILS